MSIFPRSLPLFALFVALSWACAPDNTVHVQNEGQEGQEGQNGNNGQEEVEEENGPGFVDDSGGRLVASGPELQDHLVEEDGAVLTEPIPTDGVYFDYVALQFDAQITPSIDVRVSNDDGSSWSSWTAVTLTFEEEGAHNGFAALDIDSESIKTHLQLRFTGAEREDFSFVKIEPFDSAYSDITPGEADFEPVSDDEDISIAHFELAAHRAVDVPRADWGARGHRCTRSNSPTRVVIHHSGTPTYESSSVPARVRQIQNYSQDNKGFCDMMYHFLIGQDGLIYEGRSERLQGAHAGGANFGSIGIVFIGDYSHAPPSDAMMDAGARLMAALSDEYGIHLDRNTVEGHRHAGTTSTGCPGDALYARLQQLIDGAYDVSGGSTTPQGCTQTEEDNCAVYGCGCVAGECSGGNCSGSGCTSEEIGACNNQGCGCVDGECSGGACEGSGCTDHTENQCNAFGCGCVDGACSDGACGEPSFDSLSRFHPVSPYRAADTRNGAQPVKAGTTRMFDLPGVPADAEAVTANITAVNPTNAGYLTVYPCGERPGTSSLNYQPGEARPGQVTVSLSALNQVCVYSLATVDVIIDISGWWRPTDGMQVDPWTTRFADTRAGDLGGRISRGQTRSYDFSGQVGPSTKAVSLNVTAVHPSDQGYITVFPCADGRPESSHLNLQPDITRANHLTVPLDADQRVCFYTHQTDTDLLIDLTGTWSEDGDQQLTPHAPTRITDTRGSNKVSPDTDTQIHHQTDGVVFASLVVVDADQAGYAAVYSCQDGYRGASTLNFPGDQATGNAVVVDASRGGVCARTSASAHMIFDTFATQR